MGLEINNINKSFNTKKVLNNISFKMDKPGVFGLIGSNGAGKTTLIRIILGILSKDSGTISWNGKKLTKKTATFGYLPEERGIYTKVKVGKQLTYFAKLRGMSSEDAILATEKWCKELGMEEYLNVPAEQLSKGNQQKIQLISAFVNNPDILFLDEPFSGLDPVNTQVIKKAINNLVEKGTYIILSTHQMSVVEEYCSDILLINKGNSILSGSLTDIKKSYGQSNVYIKCDKDIFNFIPSNSQIISKGFNSYELKLSEEPNKFLQKLLENNISITQFEIKEPSLEEIFIRKVSEN